MPVLKNARHEKFAQELVSGKTIDAAYVAAGYARNPGNACRLNDNEKIKARVREIQGAAAEEAKVTAGEIIYNLRRVVEIGLTGQDVLSAEGVLMYVRYDLAPANKALELLGKTIGLFNDEEKGSAPTAVIVQYPIERK